MNSVKEQRINMKVLSVLPVFWLCLIFEVIEADFTTDGQISCVYGKREKRGTTGTSWLASPEVAKKDVKFFLYDKMTNDKNFDPVEIHTGDERSLQYGNFDATKLTKIFIHGYKSHKNKKACVFTRQGFFKNGDFNVIIVDWSAAQHRFGVLWPYDAVVKKIDAVGQRVVDMFRFLERNGMDLSKTTLVGHSLGAHVAGIAGNLLDGKIGRLVGLDPAGPLISTRSDNRRLSKNDAVQVEIIHSEMDQCGLKNQMGHYDFYPNGGRSQPGCDTNSCSHSRAYRYFAESLDPQSKGFYGKFCNDWSDMQEGKCNGEVLLMGGLNTKSGPEGIYYLKTNDDTPYAQGRP